MKRGICLALAALLLLAVTGCGARSAAGGMTQNEEGYWQTPDAVSGATLSETPTYLDMLKTLYERIQAGDYVAEN